MTRIIAGKAGSLALVVPDAGTRPTSDRVRESLFGALESADLIDGAAVLDLFAGSGALGLESLSRGCASVELVERAPKAASVAERNARAIAKVVPHARVRVHRAAADAFLRAGSTTYDLVFIDPPYDLADEELTLTLALLAPRLSPGAVVIVERATRSGEPTFGQGLQLDRAKKYGDTTLWWARARD